MENKQIWTIIGISLVVALITSIATINMTGNLVKVPTSIATTQADVYTKAEVDVTLRNITTKKGVLSMLSNCNQTFYYSKVGDFTGITGNEICGKGLKSCLITFDMGYFHYINPPGLHIKNDSIKNSGVGFSCSYRFVPSNWIVLGPNRTYAIDAMCCSAS